MVSNLPNQIGTWGYDLHILILVFHESTRYAIPVEWADVLRTNNTKIEYLDACLRSIEDKYDPYFFQQ